MLPISSALQKLASDLLRTAPPDEAPLLAWPMACGTAVAERTRAVSFADGVLTVAAADKAWCAQLNSFSDSYLQTLNRICPVKISQLRFIIDKD
jgi:predicted nucleic acid-binding Zn ribbon protein